jgi:hypothetical protein
MLKEALRILKSWGCDIAYLCAEIEKTGSLYARGGFVPLKKPTPSLVDPAGCMKRETA